MSRFARPQTADGHSRASTLELFYDLVFVFAVTQVSHTLLLDLRWEQAGQSAVVLLAVWWSWNYTTWVTNELDTQAPAVRGLVVAVMLGSLLMSIAIPEAWGDRALLFAGAYVAIQVGRHIFLTFVAGDKGSVVRTRAGRILTWFCFSGIFWIAGGVAEGSTRTILWLIGLAIDYVAPLAIYWVPWAKRMTADVWDVATEHFSERFQLFVIIALGESVVITGATTSEIEELTGPVIAAFVVSFLGSAALWWLYFNRSAEGSQRRLEMAENRTELARDVYTYLHAVIIAGIILSAIGDELVIKHPEDALHTNELVTLIAGPVVYLLAMTLIRLRATGTTGMKRPTAALLIVVIGLVGQHASALLLASLILVVLAALIVAEEHSFHRRPGDRARFEAEAR